MRLTTSNTPNELGSRYNVAPLIRTAHLQFYTGVSLPMAGRPAHAGLCLESERYPDGVNQPAMGDNTLHPGEVCRQITHYPFGVTP
jgi:aldose 1-epimerase